MPAFQCFKCKKEIQTYHEWLKKYDYSHFNNAGDECEEEYGISNCSECVENQFRSKAKANIF